MANQPTPAQQVAQILGAQLRPINQQSRQESARLTATQLAVLKALQRGIAPVRATYDNALQQQQTLAQNAARLLAAANPNTQTQSELQSIGAPVEQQAQLAHQAQAQFPGQAAVLNVQQGSIPGASLLSQRQAQLGYLAGLPSVAALQAGESQRALNTQTQLDRARVTGQAPALLAQLQQQAADNAYRQQQAQAEAAYRAAGLSQDAAAQASLDRYRQQSLKQRGTGSAAPRIIGSAGSGYYTVDPATGQIKPLLPGTGGKSSTRGFTPYQVQRYKGTANTIAQVARKGGTATDGTALAPITYNEAVQEMEREGIPIPIAVAALNRVYPVKYRVMPNGTLKQIGGGRKRSRGPKAPQGPVGPVGTPGG